jgi:hypothetical protein
MSMVRPARSPYWPVRPDKRNFDEQHDRAIVLRVERRQ